MTIAVRKSNRKLIIASIAAAILIIGIVGGILIAKEKNQRKNTLCRDIIGDGYAMGTDPKPVVIGNTCDLSQ